MIYKDIKNVKQAKYSNKKKHMYTKKQAKCSVLYKNSLLRIKKTKYEN